MHSDYGLSLPIIWQNMLGMMVLFFLRTKTWTFKSCIFVYLFLQMSRIFGRSFETLQFLQGFLTYGSPSHSLPVADPSSRPCQSKRKTSLSEQLTHLKYLEMLNILWILGGSSQDFYKWINPMLYKSRFPDRVANPFQMAFPWDFSFEDLVPWTDPPGPELSQQANGRRNGAKPTGGEKVASVVETGFWSVQL